MKSLPIIGILILMLFVISGYVSSGAHEETPVPPAETTVRHVDPHLNYYQEHLIAMGIAQRRH